MTSLGLPSQGAAQAMGGGAVAGALASDRNASNQRGGEDGSAFVALLGALDEAGAPAHPGAAAGANGASAAPPAAEPADAATPAAAWRSVSAIHSLGSGVLVALDKRFGASAAPDAPPAPSEAPAAKTGEGADASAPADGGWAWLLLGAAGAPQSPAPGGTATATPATAGSPAAIAIAGGASARAPGATNEAAMPSDGPLAFSTPAIARNAGAPPVDVTVVRSITYLGLDPTARATGAARAASSPSSGPGPASSSSSAGSAHAGRPNGAPAAVANADDASSAASGGAQSGQGMANAGGGEPAPSKASRPTGAQPTPGSPPVATGSAAGVAQAAPVAASANGVAFIPIGQLADFVAGAASAVAPRGGDAPADPARPGAAASPAAATPVKELDVQLNPRSLGALSIQMRLANGNLNVTIAVGNPDTLKLVGDQSAAITDKLKSLSFSVESVTVKALDTAAPTVANGEAAQSGTPGHGEAFQDQSGQTADGSARGDQSFRGGGAERDPARRNPGGPGETGGDGNPGHRFV